ncbi:MAG: DUF4392 domain-containing protein [Synergistaceae bacterium]|nr:DUF4392 domain-containing protein [Synergistaceae bacterium]
MLDQQRARRLTEIVSGGISGRGPSVLCDDVLWDDAVGLIRASKSAAVITGFFVPSAGAVETDGPGGSVVLARALAGLGLHTEIWTDFRCVPVLKACAEAVGYPGGGVRDVSGIIDSVHCPDLLIYVERLGRSVDGAYYDMKGDDVSAFTSPLDELAIRRGSMVIGIGDGGNEVGMGNYKDALAEIMPYYSEYLSIVGADVAIPADVSNWGAYALVTALSLDVGDWLGHLEDDEVKMTEALVRAGAVDGLRKTPSASVDGFDLPKQLEILTALRGL